MTAGRNALVALGTAAAWGWAGAHASENPQGTLAQWIGKLPTAGPVGRSGVAALGLYALGKFGRVAPRWTLPAAFGIGAFAAVQAGRRKFSSAPPAEIMAGDGSTAYLAGDFDESDFVEGEWQEAEAR